MSSKRKSVSSKLSKLPKLDWTPSSRNKNTLTKIEKAIFDEKEEKM